MISFLAIPESLKPKVKEAFPEATFFVSEMDASTHGKPKRVRRPKIKVDTDIKDDSDMPVV